MCFFFAKCTLLLSEKLGKKEQKENEKVYKVLWPKIGFFVNVQLRIY